MAPPLHERVPLPLSKISFEPPEVGSGPTLFLSVSSDAVGFICEFANSSGVLWLTGPEKGKPSRLDGLRGFFVQVELEADGQFRVPEESPLPNLCILKSGASMAIKTATATGAPRYYTIAGSQFGEPPVFAAFSQWRAVVEANGARHILVEREEASPVKNA